MLCSGLYGSRGVERGVEGKQTGVWWVWVQMLATVPVGDGQSHSQLPLFTSLGSISSSASASMLRDITTTNTRGNISCIRDTYHSLKAKSHQKKVQFDADGRIPVLCDVDGSHGGRYKAAEKGRSDEHEHSKETRRTADTCHWQWLDLERRRAVRIQRNRGAGCRCQGNDPIQVV